MLKRQDNNATFILQDNILNEDLPGYISHYILDDEKLLAAYKTENDHVAFSSTKIVIFDSENKGKQIYTIFYKSISLINLLFEEKDAFIVINLESGKEIIIHFTNIKPKDKVRIRILYTCIARAISGLKLPKEDLKKLIKNEF